MKTEQGYPVTRTDLNQPIDSVALTLSEFGENLRLVTLETSKIKRLDLKDSPQKWEETLLHPETIHESQLHGRLQDYDISKILLGLEEMYKNS